MRTPTSPGGTTCTGGRSTSSSPDPSSAPTASRRRPRGLPKVSMQAQHDGGAGGANEDVDLGYDLLEALLDGFHVSLLLSGGLEGGERSRCEALAVGREDFDRVVAGLEPVARPGAPAAAVADRHHLAQHLDAVALPHVLEEAGAEAGELACARRRSRRRGTGRPAAGRPMTSSLTMRRPTASETERRGVTARGDAELRSDRLGGGSCRLAFAAAVPHTSRPISPGKSGQNRYSIFSDILFYRIDTRP